MGRGTNTKDTAKLSPSPNTVAALKWGAQGLSPDVGQTRPRVKICGMFHLPETYAALIMSAEFNLDSENINTHTHTQINVRAFAPFTGGCLSEGAGGAIAWYCKLWGPTHSRVAQNRSFLLQKLWAQEPSRTQCDPASLGLLLPLPSS